MSEVYIVIQIEFPNKTFVDERIEIPELTNNITVKKDLLSGKSGDYLINQVLSYNKKKISDLIKQIEHKKCTIYFVVCISFNTELLVSHTAKVLNIEENHFNQIIENNFHDRVRDLIAFASSRAVENNKGNSNGAAEDYPNENHILRNVDIANQDRSKELIDEINILSIDADPIEIVIIEELKTEEENPMAEKENSRFSGRATNTKASNSENDNPRDDDIVVGPEEHPFQTTGNPHPQIFFRKKALDCAKKHAVQDQEMETGGVLMGRIIKEEVKTLIVVTGIVRGKHNIRRTASLTFTPETWAQVLSWVDLDPIYSDEKIWSMVGWYHTHPSFGIFLSSYDLYIHKNHFQRPEHVALVIDPRRDEEGIFNWNSAHTEVPERGDLKVGRHIITQEDDEIQKILGVEKLPVPEVLDPNKKGKQD